MPVRRTTAVHRRRAASRRCDALRGAWNTHNQHGAARARSKLVCIASSPKTASAGPPAIAWHVAAGLALVAVADTSLQSRAPKESGLSPIRCPSWGLEHPQPARRGTRAQQARMLSVLPRDSERRRACARLTRARGSGLKSRSRHVIPWPRAKGETPLTSVVPSYRAQADHHQRGAVARAATSRGAPPPER